MVSSVETSPDPNERGSAYLGVEIQDGRAVHIQRLPRGAQKFGVRRSIRFNPDPAALPGASSRNHAAAGSNPPPQATSLIR